MSVTPFHATLTIVSGVSGTDVNKAVDISQDELIIGRIEPAGFVIKNPEVSRRHARIVRREGKYYVEDLGSANGTQVNGQNIIGEHALVNGDEILLGTSVRIAFAQTAEAVDESAATKPHDLPQPGPGATMFDQGGRMRERSRLGRGRGGRPARGRGGLWE